MAEVESFAEVVGHERLVKVMGSSNRRGRPLHEYLSLVGNGYEYRVMIPQSDQLVLEKLSDLTGDSCYRELAGSGSVSVSLEHLRHHDPDTTVVCVGYTISYSAGEAAALGLRDPEFPA